MRIAYIVTSVVSQIFILLYLTPALVLGFDDDSKSFMAVGLSFSGVFFIISNVLLVESVFSKRHFKSLYYDTRDQSENLTEYFETRLDSEKEKRRIFHDIPYHLVSIQALQKSGQSDKAETYIDRLADRFIDSGHETNTGNHQLNAIISGCLDKYQNAKAAVDGLLPNELSIPNHDFCVILSNLLDNAFREADALSGTVIIDLKVTENRLYIRIANPVSKKVKITDNIIQSQKHGQGIGSLNVDEYVTKSGGKVFYHCSDKCFIADLYLPL